MPTQRFYRLSEEKQKLIYEAAKKEFARVSYERASINQIVKNADISRGSFYTYFRDKEDAMKYVMEENYTQMRNVCEEALEDNGGEYLGMLKSLFEYFVDKMQNSREVMVMIENLFGKKEAIELSECMEVFFGAGMDSDRNWLVHKMNYKHLRIESEEELCSMMVLGESALYGSLQQFYLYPERLESIRKAFEAKLHIISRGAYCGTADYTE